ncbi:MAG: CopG family transcriptional regulator [Nitrospiraceae bacterium]
MRTTINLPDELLVQVKKLAAASRTTVTALIEDALREVLGKRRRGRKREPVKLKTFGNQGLLPGVDLDDTDALLDLMEPSRGAARR